MTSIEEISALNSAKRSGKPTYRFNPGDKVRIGYLTDPIVASVLHDGLCYEILFKEKTPGQPVKKIIVPWTRVRPVSTNNNTHFADKGAIRLSYTNISVEILLYRHLIASAGIDFNPSYQREYVWHQEDKEKLIESIFMGADIGKFTVRNRDDSEWLETGYAYEIIDGKQRLLTLLDFYENRFAYRGAYFNDLSDDDRHVFMNHPVAWSEVRNITKEDTLRLFIRLNRGGQPVSDEIIRNAEKQLAALTNRKEPKPSVTPRINSGA